MRDEHRVDSISLANPGNSTKTIAGNGTQRLASNQLKSPYGIFVNTYFDFYEADAENDRIQLFRAGQRNGTTVAGTGIPTSLTLGYPTDVVTDADGYLYIADVGNGRIIRAGSFDYQCIVGCCCGVGTSASQMNHSYAVRFDSQANMYVADEFNNRIQKFDLSTNSCGEHRERQPIFSFISSDVVRIFSKLCQ